MSDVIPAKDLLKQVCEKLGIPYNLTRRIVLDIPYNDIITVYVELVGTDALLDIRFESDGIDIKEVGVHAH